jgi:hypothetical protein
MRIQQVRRIRCQTAMTPESVSQTRIIRKIQDSLSLPQARESLARIGILGKRRNQPGSCRWTGFQQPLIRHGPRLDIRA